MGVSWGGVGRFVHKFFWSHSFNLRSQYFSKPECSSVRLFSLFLNGVKPKSDEAGYAREICFRAMIS